MKRGQNCGLRQTAKATIARRFRVRASEWHEVQGMNDPALAQKTRALGIDVLIDLAG